MPKTDEKLKDFEKSLAQLEKIVGRMEGGELGLEESLDQFEKGIELAKKLPGHAGQCRTTRRTTYRKKRATTNHTFRRPG